MKAYILYLLRWQASTPLLWVIIQLLGTSVWATIIANLIGGAIFFFVDREIFKRGNKTMYKLGDKVQIAGDAEDCCAAEDAGNVGTVIKIKNPNHIIVKSNAGEWGHCPKCIKPFYE